MTKKDELIRQCVEQLERMAGDNSVPKNIRRMASEVRSKILDSSKDLSVRSATAISMLEEIGNDPNMPLQTRTRIWEITSQLETVSVD